MSIDKLWNQRRRVARRIPRYEPQPPWVEVGAAIAMSGCLYVVAVIFGGWMVLAFGVLVELLSGRFPEPVDFIAIVFVVPISFFYGGVIGLIYTWVVSVPTLIAIGVAVRLLGWRPPWEKLGRFCGGLVAYVAMLPLSLGLMYAPRFGPWLVVAWLIGPAAAVFTGQIGGAVGGLRTRRKHRRGQTSSATFALPKFSLWQLMIATALVSVLLTLLRAAGLLTLPMLLATASWIAVEFVGAKSATTIARLRHHRYLRQQRVTRRLRYERLRDHQANQHAASQRLAAARST